MLLTGENLGLDISQRGGGRGKARLFSHEALVDV